MLTKGEEGVIFDENFDDIIVNISFETHSLGTMEHDWILIV